ncbi:AAA family ATPase [Microbacterium sp. ZW CA_36]|uniref:AAA family ATPase n=1 Tax=Microbacterium sp. ZW CA_36 TaxID=3378078 RepID=UPI0038549727
MIANQKGGVGKTTVTMQLGAALSRRHRVLVVDVDRQQSTVWWAENVRDRLPFDFAGNQHPSVLTRLRELRVEYDFVLVDTPGNLEDAPVLETALNAADFVVVPLTPEPLAVEPTLRTIHRLVEPRQLRHAVLLNRIDARIPSQLDTWRDLLDTTWGVPRFAAYFRQYKTQADAPVLGDLVTTLRDNRRTTGTISDVTRVGLEMTQQFAPALSGRW